LSFKIKLFFAGNADVKKKGVVRYRNSMVGYSFKYFEQVKKYFSNEIEKIDRIVERREAKKKARAEMKAKGNPYKVGQIFYNSWGWEQTNIDYYQIVRVTQASIFVRQIGKKDREETGFMSYNTRPAKDEFIGPEERKTVSYYDGGKPYIGSKYGCMTLTTEEESHNETHYA